MARITPKDPERTLPEVQKLIYKEAWRCSKANQIEFRECLSEAYHGYLCACRNYRKGRGIKFSSWTCHIIRWKLKNLVLREIEDPHILLPDLTEIVGSIEPTRSPVAEIWDEISRDAQIVLELVMDTPGELLQDSRVGARRFFTIIKYHLMGIGWSRWRFQKASWEIQERLRSLWGT